MITVAALEISNLLAGAVIVETVFAWPGLGQVTVQSILARDFLVVQGVVLLGSFVTVALNLAGRHSLQRRRSAHPAGGGAMTRGCAATLAGAGGRLRAGCAWWPVA